MRRRLGAIGIGIVTALLLAGLGAWQLQASRMPGVSFRGHARPTSAERALAAELQSDEQVLAEEIGERHERRYGALVDARDHIEARLRDAGLEPRRHHYEVVGLGFDNVWADAGPDGPVEWLVGAHYDSARGSPGGNDNASGVAVLLALAARLNTSDLPHRIQFVAFVNEEPPYFGRDTMGSRVYADHLASEHSLPHAVVVLDSLGYYTNAPRSQRYASAWHQWRFGDVGDYVALVANRRSEALLRRVIGDFRRSARIASHGAVVSESTLGASWSDHASFWRHDVAAILITDTAAFRDPHYHQGTDTGAQVNPLALARITIGLEAALRRHPSLPAGP